ncbi:hypothetical protein ES707_15307 [subsurface metagenome]
MSQNREQHTGARAKSPCCPTPSTLQENMPHMDALFANLDRGVTPNLLDFLSAISEMVAFTAKCDETEGRSENDGQKRSQIKCRLCS